MESCGTEYVAYANVTRIAEGGKELEEQCRLYLQQLSCLVKFCTRCLYGLPKAVALLGFGSARDFYEETCAESTPLWREYAKAIGCLNRAGPRIHEQLTKVRLQLHTISKTIPNKRKIDYTCCTYYDFLHATGKAINETCHGPDGSAFYTKLMDRTFGELLSLVCGVHTHGSAACRDIGVIKVPEDVKPEDVKNFVGPLIDIIHSLIGRSD